MIRFSLFLCIILITSCKTDNQRKKDLAHKICNSYHSEILLFTSDLIESNELLKTTIEPIDITANYII